MRKRRNIKKECYKIAHEIWKEIYFENMLRNYLKKRNKKRLFKNLWKTIANSYDKHEIIAVLETITEDNELIKQYENYDKIRLAKILASQLILQNAPIDVFIVK